MKKILSILFLMGLLLPMALFAQSEEAGGEFSIDMNLRPRFEYRNGYLYPRSNNDTPSAFISNRARLGVNFDNGFLSARVAAQDVSVWGQKRQNDNDGGRFTMHEAWAQLSRNGYFAKIGRQSLSYDDGRILSESGWTPTGIWHDAVKLGYENRANTLHLSFAYNQSREKTNEGTYYEPVGQPYQNMQTLWYQYRNPSGFTASALFVNLGFEVGEPGNPSLEVPANAQKAYMQTMGTNIGYKTNIWNIMGTVYYQTGTNSNDEKVSAYMLALRGRYAFDPKFSVYGGTEYHPGQDEDSDKITRMDLLYRSNHSFMGSMDYFRGYDYYGVWDKYIGVHWDTASKLGIDVRYHHFSTANAIYVGSLTKALGSEIDFTFTYPIRRHIMLEGGYSFMLATDAMPVAKGRPEGSYDGWQDWAYVSLTINPTIFRGRF